MASCNSHAPRARFGGLRSKHPNPPYAASRLATEVLQRPSRAVERGRRRARNARRAVSAIGMLTGRSLHLAIPNARATGRVDVSGPPQSPRGHTLRSPFASLRTLSWPPNRMTDEDAAEHESAAPPARSLQRPEKPLHGRDSNGTMSSSLGNPLRAAVAFSRASVEDDQANQALVCHVSRAIGERRCSIACVHVLASAFD